MKQRIKQVTFASMIIIDVLLNILFFIPGIFIAIGHDAGATVECFSTNTKCLPHTATSANFLAQTRTGTWNVLTFTPLVNASYQIALYLNIYVYSAGNIVIQYGWNDERGTTQLFNDGSLATISFLSFGTGIRASTKGPIIFNLVVSNTFVGTYDVSAWFIQVTAS